MQKCTLFFTYSAEAQERFSRYRNGVKESDIKLTNRQIIGMKTPDIVYLERLGKREKWLIFASEINKRQGNAPNEKMTENGSLQRIEEQR